ncbi:acyl-CoA-binding domain-containing protein 1 isoform X2 [Folsomia candida]|uniref:acyl-CoA-binding domain-containing protein 1 isoform X2 n=1 Tax=Folsomia candida TaxID=158441 RepID=UPI000B8FEC85|nr:acyl-CoA-binding domain-containing protein 1 isoform X2 [Folsomia candida]
MEIETSIEAAFNEAASLVESSASNNKGTHLDDKLMLQLYGLYKVATVGECKDQQPSIFNMKARWKWSAWKEFSSLSKHDAMVKYIEVVKESFGWEPNSNHHAQQRPPSSSNVFMMGNSVSSFAIPSPEEDVDEESDPVFAWAKDGDLIKLRGWLENNVSKINSIADSNGLKPLHWASDRGHLSTCQLLLKFGANPHVVDNDGMTPLEYAETCDHAEIVALLRGNTL